MLNKIIEFSIRNKLLVGLFIISLIARPWSIIICFVLITSWIPFSRSKFTPAPHRTVADLEQCAAQVCQTQREPMYLAAQAWHEFHSGYDYSFFFNKHGCFTRDIGTYPGKLNKLAVMVDQSEFDPQKSDFYELSLFGKKKLDAVITCNQELSVYLFSRSE